MSSPKVSPNPTVRPLTLEAMRENIQKAGIHEYTNPFMKCLMKVVSFFYNALNLTAPLITHQMKDPSGKEIVFHLSRIDWDQYVAKNSITITQTPRDAIQEMIVGVQRKKGSEGPTTIQDSMQNFVSLLDQKCQQLERYSSQWPRDRSSRDQALESLEEIRTNIEQSQPIPETQISSLRLVIQQLPSVRHFQQISCDDPRIKEMKLPKQILDILEELSAYRDEEMRFHKTDGQEFYLRAPLNGFIDDLVAHPETTPIKKAYKALVATRSQISLEITHLKTFSTGSPLYGNDQWAITQLTPILTKLEQIAHTLDGAFTDLSTDLILRDLSDLEKGIQDQVPSNELLQKHAMIVKRITELPQPVNLTTSKTFGDPEVIKMFPLESIKAFFNFYTAFSTIADQLHDRSLWQVNNRIDSILSQLEEDPRKVSVRTVFSAVTNAQKLLDEEIELRPFSGLSQADQHTREQCLEVFKRAQESVKKLSYQMLARL